MPPPPGGGTLHVRPKTDARGASSVLKARPCRPDGMRMRVSDTTATLDEAVVAGAVNSEVSQISVQLGARMAK